MEFLTLANSILALLSSSFALWKMFKDSRDTVQPDSEVSSLPIIAEPQPVKSPDLGLSHRTAGFRSSGTFAMLGTVRA